MNKLVTSIVVVMAAVIFAEAAEVQNVTAKQRYPWNGLVDITCMVTGINGTTNGLKFAMAAVIPDLGNARKVSHFWVVKDKTNSTDLSVHSNGNYRLIWDARADLGTVVYSNMVVRITFDINKIQLWEGGPYWADRNIGAEEPWECGYYFWWGDTVGYMRVNNTWIASDGSSSKFSFDSVNTPTYNVDDSFLQIQGWIADSESAYLVLEPEHDAAHVQWGGNWRMPTVSELYDLTDKCDWSWTTMNGVNGYMVRGKGAYASACIFLPAAGYGQTIYLRDVGSFGTYWSSVAEQGDYSSAWNLDFVSGYHDYPYFWSRSGGSSIRPVQDGIE